MKRAILIGSLVFSLIGVISFSAISNIEADKSLKTSLECIIGNKEDLGDVKVKQEISKGQYYEKEIIIEKNGVKDEGVKVTLEDDYEAIKDKKLFRGLMGHTNAESKDYLAVVNTEKKGLLVRYKKNSEYKEFYLKNNIVGQRDDITDKAILKEDDLYIIYNKGWNENYLVKVNLTTQTMVDSIKFDSKNHYFISMNAKDNKIYISAKDKKSNLIMNYYDISKKNIELKEITMDIDTKSYSGYVVKDNKLYFGDLNHSTDSKIIVYDIINNEKKIINIDFPKVNDFEGSRIDNVKETEDSFYIIGSVISKKGGTDGYIMRIDKSTGKVRYLSKLNDSFRSRLSFN